MKMKSPEPTIRLAVDTTNPGQFLACCGLLELADRLWNGAYGWFDEGAFALAPVHNDGCVLAELLEAIRGMTLEKVDPEDEQETVAPLTLRGPFQIRLDWWHDDRSGGTKFKTWAGQQKVVTIARAMHGTLGDKELSEANLLNTPAILYDIEDRKKTVEPFYFDARRSAQANSIDAGFSPDAQGMSMAVYAAVEFLCLVGLQRFRPRDNEDRTFSYYIWSARTPLMPSVAQAVASHGLVRGAREHRFRMLFRTKYLKGFLPAQFLGGDA
jgi:CRISPR-associated protein Csb3